MGLLAFGLFLLLLGAGLALAPMGPFGAFLEAAGWIAIALGAVCVVAHLAVGPLRTRGGRRID